MSQDAKRDKNNVPTALAVGNDANAEVLRLLVDPTTKRVLIDITVVAGYTEVVHTGPAKRDANDVPVALATTDDASADPIMLHADHSNGYLLVDVTT